MAISAIRRAAVAALSAAAIVGCSGGGDGTLTDTQNAVCSNAEQLEAVRAIMEEWYFFNDEPAQQAKYASLDIGNFATAAELLTFLRFRPERFDRGFSFLTTTEVDEQFFGEGQFVGFGFGSKFVDPPFNADLRLTRVFSGSPAAAAGFERGQRIVSINGRTIAEINAAEGVSAALGPSTEGTARIFRIRRLDDTEFEVEIAKALITLDPLPTTAIFDRPGAKIGYLDFRTFISTADAALDAAFAEFEDQSVNALVVDLRYNGGGLVSTAERLADLVVGRLAESQVFSETRYNSAKSAANSVERFQRRIQSLSLLQQVVFITTASSASASELVINSLRPYTVVALVGTATFGKPVGQAAFGFCDDELLLRPVTFETVNALGEGQYFGGIGVDCGAADDLEYALGDPAEDSLQTALQYVETGACGSVSFQSKPGVPIVELADIPAHGSASPAQRYAGAH
ncbi:MAG TPA: S41 family peptidase [Gammaproteobacteria bacterium]